MPASTPQNARRPKHLFDIRTPHVSYTSIIVHLARHRRRRRHRRPEFASVQSTDERVDDNCRRVFVPLVAESEPTPTPSLCCLRTCGSGSHINCVLMPAYVLDVVDDVASRSAAARARRVYVVECTTRTHRDSCTILHARIVSSFGACVHRPIGGALQIPIIQLARNAATSTHTVIHA